MFTYDSSYDYPRRNIINAPNLYKNLCEDALKNIVFGNRYGGVKKNYARNNVPSIFLKETSSHRIFISDKCMCQS